jgi:hypothetical protein
MRCPHGKPAGEHWFFGLRRFIHDDGGDCELLNGINLSCGEIAGAQMESALEGPWNDYAVRTIYSAYQFSPALRFFYLERICSFPADDFFRAFEPAGRALACGGEAALNGLYLLELYFAFTGICERVSAVNEKLVQTPLCRFLGKAGAPRFVSQENAVTRSYAAFLRGHFAAYENRLRLPEDQTNANRLKQEKL